MEIIRESSYFIWRTLCQSVHIVSQCILCEPYHYNTRLMESVFHNFNLLKLVKQLIIHIKIGKLCREVHYMCRGKQYLKLQEWWYCISPYKKNTSYYYVSYKQESTGIQIIYHLLYCLWLWIRYYYHWLDSKHETICVQYWGII